MDSPATPHRHLYLVDGSAYIFRAYHRLPPLTNPRGVPVGAVYGYTTMLWKLAEDLHKADGPTHLAVILDKGSTTFRNALYDQYKANRPPPPEDLVPQFPLIRDATRAFSLPCIEEDDLEADDLIAAYARAATAQGWDVTIVSSDKDLMQLVGQCGIGGGCVDMLDTMKNQRIGIPEVIEKFGVPPEKVGDVLALMGDAVDNVPGIRGIGPKTATKLIQEHGDLESALAAAPGMKAGKLRDSLIEQADMARLSRTLVALKEDCALPIPLEDFELTAIPPDPLAAFLTEHGFTSLLRKLGGGASAPASGAPALQAGAGAGADAGDAPAQDASRQPLPEWPAVERGAYACVQSMGELHQWIARAFEARVVAVDTETSALDSMRADLVGVSLALGPNDACYIPLGHRGSDMFSEAPLQMDKTEALAALKPLLESEAVLKVGQNVKYDITILARAGEAVGGITMAPVDDTMVMSFCLDAGRSETGLAGHGMDELSDKHLGHATMKFKDLCGTGKKAISFAEVPLADATRYAAEDADVTWRLHRLFAPRLADEGGTRIYQRVDRPLVPVVAGMERHGIKVDRARLSGLSTEFAHSIAALETRIHEKCGGPFTIGSPKQLGDVLFDKLGYKGGKKGKSGQYSTDQSVLETLAGQGAEVATLVLEWRQLSKLKSTYTDALQAAINPETGRVHTSYSLVGAQTGRLSSNDPNLQNIPIRTEIGRQIRDAFVAEPGNVLLAADYSQIELRLAAHMADVPALKDAFAQGEDIHARTAMEMFGVVDRDTRGRAKTINFAILYGISRWGLGGRLGVTAEEAQAMIDRYFERFPGIQRYILETLEQVRERGYSETLFGRKTWFPRINSKNQAERQGSERAAINAPIQGTSADIIKRAMVRMMPALEAAGLGHVRMLLQVHDELVFELPEADVERARPVIEAVMARAAEPAVSLTVPLGVEIGTGPSWGAAH
ncbi:DNA polymerase I [Novosphingobium sp. KCTC 2891]|uniref:DNA polymerase I n=1 Tax=Novosphingobium sp. KCTC 2891 TaxID=2989730 RepID=UPI0022236AFE|nr:DNA polymerase I [Novosphingobium sp. KCTC 2891]MCW1382185.1 DNA polymerase I [Novosphingobium sp. KCTC 2891]